MLRLSSTTARSFRATAYPYVRVIASNVPCLTGILSSSSSALGPLPHVSSLSYSPSLSVVPPRRTFFWSSSNNDSPPPPPSSGSGSASSDDNNQSNNQSSSPQPPPVGDNAPTPSPLPLISVPTPLLPSTLTTIQVTGETLKQTILSNLKVNTPTYLAAHFGAYEKGRVAVLAQVHSLSGPASSALLSSGLGDAGALPSSAGPDGSDPLTVLCVTHRRLTLLSPSGNVEHWPANVEPEDRQVEIEPLKAEVMRSLRELMELDEVTRSAVMSFGQRQGGEMDLAKLCDFLAGLLNLEDEELEAILSEPVAKRGEVILLGLRRKIDKETAREGIKKRIDEKVREKSAKQRPNLP